MTDELTFYTHPMSRGRVVRWVLEEIGQPYRTERLGYGTAIFSGGDAKERAIRFADREYGAFDEIELEPCARV
jgi:glutathione S-transferase